MNNLKYMFLLSLFIIMFLPAMVIPIGSKYMLIGLPLILMVFITLFYISQKKLLKKIVELCKLRSTKYLISLLIISIFSACIAFVFHNISLFKMLFSIFLAIILSVLLPYSVSYISTKYFNEKLLIRFYILVLYCILAMAIVEFIIFYFKIPFLQELYNSTILNSRLYKLGEFFSIYNLYKNSNIFRLQSVFEEPSHFAWFICINLPLFINLSLTKYRILKNKYINKFIKITILPFGIFDLIGTKSPINCLIALIVVFTLYLVKHKKNIKKIIKVIFFTLICLYLFFYFVHNATPEQSILYRINIVVNNLNNFENLILLEGSLTTRLIYYTLMFKIFLKNIIFGCGWGNLGIMLHDIIKTTAFPLTQEIIDVYQESKDGTMNYCLSIFFRTIAETGILGVAVLYLFFIRIKKYVHYLFMYSNGICREFYEGIDFAVLIYIILSFYDSNLFIQYFWCLFGFIAGTYTSFKIKEVNNANNIFKTNT